METKNFFLERKNLLIIFLTLAFLLVGVSTFTYRGLILDQPAIFFSVISGENSPHWVYLFHNEPKVRLFSGIIYTLPLNIFIHFLPDNLIYKNNLFCFSYSIMTLLFMCFNIWLSNRTKRYDIAVWAVVFYALFYLPNSVWFARNIHISVLMQFALLQYFLSTQKLKISDYFFLFILTFGVWESSENAILPAGLMFLYTVFIKIFEPQKLTPRKLWIGLSSILCCIYITARMEFIFTNSDLNISPTNALSQYFDDIITSFSHLFDCCFIFTTMSVIIMLYFVCRKRTIAKFDVPVATFILIGTCIYFWKISGFEPSVNSELDFYVLPIFLMFFATFFILFCDYKGYSLNSIQFYPKLLSVALVCGCLYGFFQINSCRYSYAYAMEFLQKINNDEKVSVIEKKEDLSKYFFAYDTCFGTLHRTMILGQKKAEEKLILPYKDVNNIENYEMCMTPTYYNSEERYVTLQSVFVYENNKYFDMEKMKELLQSANIEYK